MNYIDKLSILYDGEENAYEAEARQIRIVYHAESQNLEKYIEINQDKHIYIYLKESDFGLDALRRLQSIKQYENWTLQIALNMILDEDTDETINHKTINEVKFQAIKECCNSYMFTDLIGNWEILNFILFLEPSEVRITNMLCFCLNDVRKLCKNVGIRIIPNVAQSAWQGSSDITKFFIRPEDIDEYTEYVSGFDFMGDNNIQEVCYKVYKRGTWNGNLKELIIGLNEDIDSRRIPPDFGKHRMNCKKRCMMGSRCHLCRAMQSFAETLEKTDSVIKQN